MDDEQLRYETETADVELGHAIHGVSSSIAVLVDAVTKHRRYVTGSDLRFIRESATALNVLLELLTHREAAE